MEKHHSSKAVRPSQERRAASNERIKGMGIACLEQLPLLPSADQVRQRSLDEICRRAIACLLSTQLGCDIENDEYDEGRELFGGLLERFGVADCLNEKEQRLFDGTYSKQDAIDVVWTYECYWALCWALGLIEDDIADASRICDCDRAIRLVAGCASYEEFRQNCRPREMEEILDMLDLFYRYDWACTEKRLHPETTIGSLNPEVVTERRRGLEWLIAEKEDWFYISLDT